jgi:asparagine synthase (glutamine-hydrolysing)
MVAALGHRGPDESGVERTERSAIGVARLAIIDVAHGHQPLLGPEGTSVLACNGEIYGHRRLRSRLADYPFRTHSDVEVALALHRRHGDDFLSHLPGTFALALWDEAAGELVLARDRFGERPLYWLRTDDGQLAFASELRALGAGGLLERRVDRRVLAEVLRQGYVTPGTCIWEGVGSLGPAQRLRWRPGGEPVVERWWEPPPVGGRSSADEAVEWFRTELDRAVQDQLVADVPVGAFLSGGLDSSVVAALAARHHPGIEAFAFDMPGSTEVPHARSVAERHGIRLHVCSTDLPAGTLPGLLREVSATWDEPFADSSAVPTWILSRFAREHVTVTLTGDGADELLGGYLCWARGYLEPDDPVRTGAPAPGGGRLARLLGGRRRGPRSVPEVASRYAAFRAYLDDGDLARLGLPAVGRGRVELDRYPYGTADDISRFDLDHYLPGDILVKTDRAAMAHSLEVRAPYLDVAVAEGCLRLPPHHKVDAEREKLLLRRAFGDLLPPTVTARPKQGFGAPMDDWLRRDDVAGLVQELVVAPGSVVSELVDGEAAAELVAAGGQRAWNLLSVALWWEHQRAGATA